MRKPAIVLSIAALFGATVVAGPAVASPVVAAGPVAGASLVASSVTSASVMGAKERSKPLVVFMAFGTREILDLGDPGATHGDVTTGTGPITKTLGGPSIGNYVYRAETIEGRDEDESRLTTLWVNLPGGSLVVTSLIDVPIGAPPTKKQLFVILGGTGKYAAAQGTMTLTPGFQPRSSRLAYRFVK